MHYIQFMQVFDSLNDLLEEFAGLWFFDTWVCDDVVEEFSAWCVLHDEVELLLRFDDFVQLNDVWMSDHFEDVNFPGNSFNVCHVRNSIFFKYLNGYLLTSENMLA